MPDTVLHSATIPSVQCRADGAPRFHLAPLRHGADIARLRSDEQSGGVDAEFRVFLDAQLESGDLYVDLAPDTGFVLLTAATHEQRPRVIVGSDERSLADMVQANAHTNGVKIEVLSCRAALEALADGSWRPASDEGGRLFVQVASADLQSGAIDAERLAEASGLTALLVRVSDGHSALERQVLLQRLAAVGFALHALVDTDEGPALVAVDSGTAAPALFALPTGAAPERTTHHEARKRTRTTFNFIAQFCRTGYGITGANLLKALARLDADVAYFPLGAVDRSIADVPTLDVYLDRQADFDERAPSVRMSQEFDLALHVGRGARIGFPIFETDRFTARERHHLRHNERLLVCTAWARDVLRENGIEVPVSLVPLGVDRTIFHERVSPATSSGDTVFVQVGKIEPRKGQLDLLEAFEAAFTPRDTVRLRLYCHNPFLGGNDLERLLAPFRASPMASRIELITVPLPTQHDVACAMMAADCGVFCSRAEGWNLEALEMLSLGKTVIATDYSGHTEFLSADNARLVPVSSREVFGVGSWGGFGAAEKEALVHHLRAVHEERRAGTLALNHAGIATAVRYSWESAAQRLLEAVIETNGR